jgi:hypothetical protein
MGAKLKKILRRGHQVKHRDHWMIAQSQMQEIADTAAVLIGCADHDSFAALIILPVDEDGKPTEHCHIAILPGLRAIRGELLMINEGFSRNESERLQFINVFVRLIQPLLEGGPKIRFVREEKLDRLIILPLEPNDDPISLGHAVASFSKPESALPSA